MTLSELKAERFRADSHWWFVRPRKFAKGKPHGKAEKVLSLPEGETYISIPLRYAIEHGLWELRVGRPLVKPGRLVRIVLYQRLGLKRAAEQCRMTPSALSAWLLQNEVPLIQPRKNVRPVPRGKVATNAAKKDQASPHRRTGSRTSEAERASRGVR